MNRVLLTGATGFVGRRLHPALVNAGWEVVSATRRAEEARLAEPNQQWVTLDVDREETLGPALEGVHSVVYLIHSMGQGGDFEETERAAAERFVRAADAAEVKRIVYLGGVAPQGVASKHLRSRLATGELLAKGRVPVIELRSGMIIGAGGASWQMVRDLAARLPFMILPSWLQNRSQPIALDDVVAAIVGALGLPADVEGCLDVPGPEAMSGEELLRRIGALLGIRAFAIRVPVLSPRLSSHWLRFVTRAEFSVAQELVEGLTSDLIAVDEGIWKYLPEHRRIPFDVAAREALDAEAKTLPLGTKVLEYALQRLSRSA